jgi:hypothetical protein
MYFYGTNARRRPFNVWRLEMKKGIIPAFAVLMLVFAAALPAHARDGHRGGRGGHSEFVLHGGVWIGPPWWGGPWWWGPPYYPYYPYYPYPPSVEETPVYVQPPAQEQQDEGDYWYYCTNPQGFYPYVKQCPKGWLRVIPTPSSEVPEGE